MTNQCLNVNYGDIIITTTPPSQAAVVVAKSDLKIQVLDAATGKLAKPEFPGKLCANGSKNAKISSIPSAGSYFFFQKQQQLFLQCILLSGKPVIATFMRLADGRYSSLCITELALAFNSATPVSPLATA